MKILMVSNKIPYPLKDGGVMATHHMAKGLIDAGAHIDLLAMNTSKHKVKESTVKKYLIDMGIGLAEFVDTNTDISFIRMVSNLLFSGLPYNAVRFITKKFRIRLQEMLIKGKYDLIQFEGLYLMPYADTIRKYSKARIAFRAHNIEHEIWQRNSRNQSGIVKRYYSGILARRLEKFESGYMNEYDLMVPITSRDAMKFNEMGNNRFTYVCPFGFDFNMPANTEFRKETKDIFYIGSLDWLPNQEGLFWFIRNVWEKILVMHPEVHFFVAGRNAPSRLRRFFSEHHVDFMGEVDDASRFMENKAIMVVPLFSGSGMRVKIIEAMAAGKVVITTSLGAEGIDPENGKQLVIADNENDFASGIIKLLSNRDDYLYIAKNAINFIKTRYDNSTIIAGLFEFYKSKLS
ncbi:MAG: glycosyltransferase family 4 protein [Bacteroidales bacterium]|nr:glycosyltransferase family 4 protein [Bacteroidales bacterium]